MGLQADADTSSNSLVGEGSTLILHGDSEIADILQLASAIKDAQSVMGQVDLGSGKRDF